MIIYAIVPARSGSKSIPNKCVVDYNGKPLMAHSIELALQSKFIDKVVLTTDSAEYAKIAKQYGAEANFLRPAEISGDLSPDYDFFAHYLSICDTPPDIFVHLRPTYPNRSLSLLNDTIQTFIDNYDRFDSLRTVIPFDKSPFKMYTIDDGVLSPLFKQWGNIIEPYNRCRQELSQCYLHNGCIDIVKTSVILEKKSVTGYPIYPYVMKSTDVHDIDTYEDMAHSEQNICS